MHVFEDDPVFAVIFKALFVLIGLRVGLEVDEVAAVFLARQNGYNGRAVPTARFLCHRSIGTAYAALPPVVSWSEHMFFGQPGGNLLCAETVHVQTEYTFHHRSRFIVHDPALTSSRVFHVPVWWKAHGHSCVSAYLVADSTLFAYIPAVPLVEQVADGREFVFSLVCVDAVRY